MALAALGGPVGFVGTASAANTVSGCTTIDSPGTYQLDSGVTDSGQSTCIDVTASDVVVDGQGNTIDGTNATDSIAVNVAGTGLSNVTVRNVTLSDWDTGVYTEATDTAINDSTIGPIDETAGVVLSAADGTVIADNEFRKGVGSATRPVDSGLAGSTTDDVHVLRNDVVDWGDRLSLNGRNQVIRGNSFSGTPTAIDLSVTPGSVVADNTYTSDGTGRFLDVDRGDDTTITGNDVVDAGAGIRVDHSTDVTVSDNAITDVGLHAIEVTNQNGPVDDATISNNDIDASGDTAIFLHDGPGSTVANNQVTDSGGVGINVTLAGRTTVRDNVVRNSDLAGLRLQQSDDATLASNTVRGNNRAGSFPNAGVYVNGSADVTLRDNVVRNNRIAGLRIRYADRIEIRNNRVTENCGGQFGISLAETADALVVGNNVSNNTGIGMQVFADSPNLVVRDSRFDDNGGLGGFQGEPGTTMENVTANGNDGYGISARTGAVLRTVTARNNTNQGLLLVDDVTLDGGTVADNGAAEIEVVGDLTATALTVEGARLAAVDASAVDIDGPVPPSPALPTDRQYVGTNLSVQVGADGYFDVEVSYSDAEVSSFDVSTLALWRDTGGTWSEVDGTRDASTNTVTGNTTASGTLAVLAAGNDPPTAAITAPASPTEGDSLAFDGSASTDPDGSIVAYDWAFGDGTTATGVDPSHTYSSPGDYTVELTVTDDAGATATTTEVVSVGSASTGGGGGDDGGFGVGVGGRGGADDPGEFDVRVTVPTRTIEPGDDLSVTATVRNTGTRTGETTVGLFLDGDATGANRTVELGPGDETQLTLATTVSDPGEYEIRVAGTDAGSVTVREATARSTTTGPTPTATTLTESTATPATDTDPAPATTPGSTPTSAATATPTDATTTGSGPGFGVLGVLVAMLVVTLFRRRE